jgi:hypothetical protein
MFLKHDYIGTCSFFSNYFFLSQNSNQTQKTNRDYLELTGNSEGNYALIK